MQVTLNVAKIKDIRGLAYRYAGNLKRLNLYSTHLFQIPPSRAVSQLLLSLYVWLSQSPRPPKQKSISQKGPEYRNVLQ